MEAHGHACTHVRVEVIAGANGIASVSVCEGGCEPECARVQE